MLQTLTTEFSKIKRTCAVTSKKISILKRGLKSKEYDKRLEEWRKVGKSLSFYKNELIRILTGEFKNSNTENTKFSKKCFSHAENLIIEVILSLTSANEEANVNLAGILNKIEEIGRKENNILKFPKPALISAFGKLVDRNVVLMDKSLKNKPAEFRENTVKEIERINKEELRRDIPLSASWHAKYKDSCYVFVGGLDYDFSEGDIICIFSQFGEITDCNLIKDKRTHKSLGYAFVSYEDQRSTVLAVDNFNGAKINGRTLRCDHVLKYRRPTLRVKDDELEESSAEEGQSDADYEARRKIIWDRALYQTSASEESDPDETVHERKRKREEGRKAGTENDPKKEVQRTSEASQLERVEDIRRKREGIRRKEDEVIETLEKQQKDYFVQIEFAKLQQQKDAEKRKRVL